MILYPLIIYFQKHQNPTLNKLKLDVLPDSRLILHLNVVVLDVTDVMVCLGGMDVMVKRVTLVLMESLESLVHLDQLVLMVEE